MLQPGTRLLIKLLVVLTQGTVCHCAPIEKPYSGNQAVPSPSTSILPCPLQQALQYEQNMPCRNVPYLSGHGGREAFLRTCSH